MICKHPSQSNIPELRALWKRAFGDTEGFLDAFFQTAFSPERSLAAFFGEQLAGMLYWFDTELEGRKFAYIYAVATAPEFRGRGVCRELMGLTHALLADRGYAGALLVPQTEELRKMYAAFGYDDCGGIREWFCASGGKPVEIHGIEPSEYARLRRQLLPPGSVVQEGENLDFLQTQVRFYRGTDFLLAAQGTPESALFGTELLGNTAAAPGILLSLGYPQGTFRSPGDQKRYAMLRPLAQDAPTPSYFGFSFD